MIHLVVTTQISAPAERCFLLSLSIDLHLESTAQTSEQVISGVSHGLIGLGETVKWRGRHFGLMHTHESVISVYDQPQHFRDEMIAGRFRNFVHDHYFETTEDDTTLMRDELRFAAPFGPLGWIAERLLLRSYFIHFLEERNAVIKRIAESSTGEWKKFLS